MQYATVSVHAFCSNHVCPHPLRPSPFPKSEISPHKRTHALGHQWSAKTIRNSWSSRRPSEYSALIVNYMVCAAYAKVLHVPKHQRTSTMPKHEPGR